MTKPIDELNNSSTDAKHLDSQPQPTQSAVYAGFDPTHALPQQSENEADVTAPRPSIVTRFGRLLPTAVVLAALAVLGHWGHKTGWKIPKFSTLLGSGEQADRDWCAAHNVPGSICISCKADLLPKGKLHGWCKKHGIHECSLCNPELAQLKKAPNVSQADLNLATTALSLRPRAENNSRCKLHLRRIQFASVAAVEKAGIDIDVVERAPIIESILANGEITYDQTCVARLSSRVPGAIWRANKQVGDRVKRGELLAIIDAVTVGRAKGELLQALVQMNYHRENHQRLANVGGGAVAGRRLQEAETAWRDAKVRVLGAQQTLVNLGLPVTVDELQGLSEDQLAQRIGLLGLPKEIVELLDPANTTANLVPLTAPLDGLVVTREVVAGEVVDTSKILFTVADTAQMWLSLNVRLEDAKYLAIGQVVRFRPDGNDHDVLGKISWISTGVDRQTRTVKVRADLANPSGQLRDKTFGTGRIVLREEKNVVVVPKDAVHWEGCCHIVFVRDKTYFDEGSYKVFHTRSVRPGAMTDDHTELIAGVLPGEVIVAKGSGALRAELLKGNLGPG